MLSARKLHLVAGLKVHGLSLRQAELDFYVLRYIAVTGISTIMTGFAYVGLIKIKIPEEMRPVGYHFAWQVFAFYVCASLTLAFSLFNVVLTGFLVVNAQGLTLRGPPNSVSRCVEILGRHWILVRTVLACSLLCLVLSVASIVWMKLDDQTYSPWPAIGCSSILLCALGAAVHRMTRIMHELAIPSEAMVTGALTVGQQNAMEGGGAGGAFSGDTRLAHRVDLISENQAAITVSQR